MSHFFAKKVFLNIIDYFRFLCFYKYITIIHLFIMMNYRCFIFFDWVIIFRPLMTKCTHKYILCIIYN